MKNINNSLVTSFNVLEYPSRPIITTSSMAWALLGFTKSALLKKNIARTNVFDTIFLSANCIDDFSSKTWLEIGLSPDEVSCATSSLAAMFPGKLNNLEGFLAPTPWQTAEKVYQSWMQGEGDVVFYTSGSSGKPKAALQSYEMIAQEVTEIGQMFSDIKSIIALTPLNHCYAFLFATLLHQFLNVPLKSIPPLPTLLKKELQANTLVVGFPDFWKAIAELNQAPSVNVYCLSAGAAWPKHEQAQLRKTGYTNTVEIFGSSENGAIGKRLHYTHNFTLLSYFKRLTPSMEEDVNSTFFTTKQEGVQEFLLRLLPSGKKNTVPLQDCIDWKSENEFLPLKRVDKAVQISGINVYPEFIAETIKQLPGVKDCKIRLMRPEEGYRLKGFIVLENENDNIAELRKALKQYCRQHLSAPERPAKYTFGLELPKLCGKDSDW